MAASNRQYHNLRSQRLQEAMPERTAILLKSLLHRRVKLCKACLRQRRRYESSSTAAAQHYPHAESDSDAYLSVFASTACDVNVTGVDGQCIDDRTGEPLKQVRDVDGQLWSVEKAVEELGTLTLEYCGASINVPLGREATYNTDGEVYHPGTGEPIRVEKPYRHALATLPRRCVPEVSSHLHLRMLRPVDGIVPRRGLD